MQTSTMTTFVQRSALLAMLLGALFLFLIAPAEAAHVQKVSGDTAAGENELGWLFNRDPRTATPFSFDPGPATLGIGSLYVAPIANDYDESFGSCSGGLVDQSTCDKFIAEYFPDEMPVADLELFSYDFLIGAGGDSSDANEFYLNVYANFGSSDPEKFYDCRYNVVPSTGSTADWTTVEFDPTETYSVVTRGSSPFACPGSLADMDTVDPSGSAVIRAFAINLGDTSGNDQDLDGYFDNVVVDTTETESVEVAYDFDPVDQDNDGVADVVDNCPAVANPGQEDQDGDGIGDVCDDDVDGDGTNNDVDNCPVDANADQADLDGDGIGDVCDPLVDVVGAIVAPEAGSYVVGMTTLLATYNDFDEVDDDPVNWAVRPYSPNCNTGSNLFGGGPNVSGVVHPSPFTFDGKDFEAHIDTSLVTPGHYCFAYNPKDDAGHADVREVVDFYIADTYINGGGHILEGEGKKKDLLDVSFGGWVADIGDLVGSIQINFHNVGDETVVADKSKFHGEEIVGLTYASGAPGCDAAMNFTAHGTFNGEEGWSVVVRGGDNGDTLRVQLFDHEVFGAPTTGHVYDTHAAGEFTDESTCYGTARTGLDNGNISIQGN